MRKAATLLCYLWILTLDFGESTNVCNYCKCTTFPGPEPTVTVDCQRNKLNVIPLVTDWPENVTSLDLSFNNISSIDVEMGHTRLKTLKLNNNRISSMVPAAFGSLYSMKYLDLSHNLIQRVETQSFRGLEGLEILNMSNNVLKMIEENTFVNLFELEDLVLAGNPIGHFESIIPRKLLNLKRLDLRDTGVYYLPDGIFSTLDRLTFLDLSENDFNVVPTNAIRSASGLKWLKMDQNPIDRLDKTSFTKLKSLEILEISFMDQLTSIGPRTFSDLKSLQVLRANANHKLSYVDPEAFAGLFTKDAVPTLQEMSFEMNRLTQLDGREFPCSKMEILNFQKNPWHCDCNLKWMKRCPSPSIYTADLICDSPSKFRGFLVANMAEDDFRCETRILQSASDIHHDRVLRLTSVVMGCVLLVIIALTIIFVLKWKSIKSWWKSKRKGPGAVYYVRTHTNPIDA